METQKKISPQTRRRWLWPAVIGGFLLLTAAILIILIAYSPRSYTPIVPENPQEVSPYLTHTLGPDFYNNVQLDEPFELIVDQAGLNDIFSHYPWPLAFDGISIYMPMIHISPEQTILMAQVDFKGLSTILSIYGSPCLDSEGKMNLNIQSVYLGALPITPLARHLAQQYVSENFDLNDPIEAVNLAIVTNQPFDPIVYISDHAARITKLTIEPARARLILTPIRK
jgi:hypothetical protein